LLSFSLSLMHRIILTREYMFSLLSVDHSLMCTCSLSLSLFLFDAFFLTFTSVCTHADWFTWWFSLCTFSTPLTPIQAHDVMYVFVRYDSFLLTYALSFAVALLFLSSSLFIRCALAQIRTHVEFPFDLFFVAAHSHASSWCELPVCPIWFPLTRIRAPVHTFTGALVRSCFFSFFLPLF
jgi:hypothetical protein